VTTKYLATAVAAFAAIGAAITSVTFVVPVGPTFTPHIRPVVLGAPLPQDPAAGPTVDQLAGVLSGLQGRDVPFASKGNLVEGGSGAIEGPIEARVADAKSQQTIAGGALPLAFTVANITPAGAAAATADVTASGPKLPATTRNVTFVNQGGWKISRASAMTLLQEAGVGV
jgi:hypothetical protein